jgi:hypothetical protein
MKGISVYVGAVVVSDDKENGGRRVSSAHGVSWHGLDPLQLAMLEGRMAEHRPKLDAVVGEIEDNLQELGVIAGLEQATQEEKDMFEKVSGAKSSGKSQL